MHGLVLNFTSLPRSQDAAIPGLVLAGRRMKSTSESAVPALFLDSQGPPVRQNTAWTPLHPSKTGRTLYQAVSVVLANSPSVKPRDEDIMLMAVRAPRTCQKSGARRAFGSIIANAPAIAFAIRKTSVVGTVAAKIVAEWVGLATKAGLTYSRRQHTCQSWAPGLGIGCRD
jgi:hypothetical protein